MTDLKSLNCVTFEQHDFDIISISVLMEPLDKLTCLGFASKRNRKD